MKLAISLSACSILSCASALAELKMPSVFSDHMVLQRGMEVPVWGTADANARVAVRFGGQQVKGRADADGKWMLKLRPLKASKQERHLEVFSDKGDKLKFEDVLVGEVWLASGQSNMEWTPRQVRKEDLDGVRKKTVTTLRLFNIPKKGAYQKQDDVDAQWTHSTPDAASEFSAAAWYFGKKLHDELNVPIGIIRSAYGGSRIEPWINEEGYNSVPELEKLYAGRLRQTPGTPQHEAVQEKYRKALAQWQKKSPNQPNRKPKQPPVLPANPERISLGLNTAGLYEAMIHPIVPFGIKGIIWYQGESNIADGKHYGPKHKALIQGWREVFQNPNAPFYFVQIAPFTYGPRGNLAELQFTQQSSLSIPNTGMVVVSDIGNTRDIHPKNKSDVGYRLANWALAKNYGKNVPFSGPLYSKYEQKGSTIVVSFQHAKGLKTRDGKTPSHFEIADKSGKWTAAKAQIKGHQVILSADGVSTPTQARFAWHDIAVPNLCNAAGLPAACFHTHWPQN